MENNQKRNWWQVIIGLLGIYLIFLVYQALSFNYQASKKIKDLKKEVSSLELKKNQLEDLIVYYKTDTFMELEARKKLGFKKAGENVLVVKTLESENQQKKTTTIEGEKSAPNYSLWIKFFNNQLEE